MPFVKAQLQKPYYKRYQVKYKRRRQGKTDYYARKKLTIQAKNKYASPKYRLVVRSTCSQIICQIVKATIMGDETMAAAHSQELPRYGLKVGLKNYSAAYCTGLLVGRRLLLKLGLNDKYTGTGDDLPEDEVDGEIMTTTQGKKTYFVDELDEERRPFRCYLDVGLKKTSLGAKLFGALKGAADAGLDIPHNPKKFPGYDADNKEYDASAHRDRIFGSSVAEYMTYLQEDDEQSGTHRFEELFRTYADAGVGPEDLEDLYLSVHKAIREDPSPKHKESAAARRPGMKFDTKYKKMVKLTSDEKRARIAAKRAELQAAKDAEDESEDESEEEEDED